MTKWKTVLCVMFRPLGLHQTKVMFKLMLLHKGEVVQKF